MAWNFFSGYYLLNHILSTIFVIVFLVLLFMNFFRKRTIGTLLLLITFFFFFLSEVMNLLSTWFAYYEVLAENNVGMLQVSIPIFFGIGFIFLYYFSNRHILQDSDVVKGTISTVTNLVLGIGIGMMVADLFYGLGNRYVTPVILKDVDIYIYSPAWYLRLAIFLPVALLIVLRVIFRIIKISRNVEKRLTKIGFRFILYSIVCLILTVAFSALIGSNTFNDIPFAIIAAEALRSLIFLLALMFGYVGWVMPEFVKRHIRGKAWITKQMQKEITTTTLPIASSEKASNIAFEVTEK
ncbi:MAG: hypothetical protein FK733_13105 [Asgard group archaeon]|nr:hypothetical protein [Asgard group archaeon]